MISALKVRFKIQDLRDQVQRIQGKFGVQRFRGQEATSPKFQSGVSGLKLLCASGFEV